MNTNFLELFNVDALFNDDLFNADALMLCLSFYFWLEMAVSSKLYYI